jgi:type IV secretion system protein VirD4
MLVILDKLVSKFLSKIVSGKIGMLVHVIVMYIVYLNFISSLLTSAVFGLLGLVGLHIPADYGVGLMTSITKSITGYNVPVKVSTGFLPMLGTVISSIIGILLFIVFIIGSIKVWPVYKAAAAEKKAASQPFGNSRFSELNEIISAGLQGAGIVFGKMKGKLITKPSTVEGHTLIVGAPGTGKSRGVAIPSLLLWQGSAVVMDIKGELSKITSERRKQYGKVFIFNPESETGDCYDPILQCGTIDGAQELARTLVPLPKDSKDPFWIQAAQALLSAFIFEGAKTGGKLCSIAKTLCMTPITDLIEHCYNSDIEEVRLLASIAYDMPEKTLNSVVSELKTKLITLATDKNIARATSKSDWTPETLEFGATIYLKVSEHLLEQYRELWTVIISQLLRFLSKRNEYKQPPILIMLDEMPRLSEIKGLTSALSTLRSRNVHIMCIIQSMAQLDMIYGKDQRKVIADNCSFKFVLSASDPETQKYFSDLAGQKTSYSKSYGGGGRSESEQGTPLILPADWAHLDKPILLSMKLQPAKLDLAFWDKEGL